MNPDSLDGAALEKALASKLQQLLAGISWLRGWRVKRVASSAGAGLDLVASIPVGDSVVTLNVDCKRELLGSAFFLNGSQYSTAA